VANPSGPTLTVVLAALRSSDERAHAIAVEWLVRFSEEPIRRLVLEATDTKHPVEYRLHVLRAAATVLQLPAPGEGIAQALAKTGPTWLDQQFSGL
jgi:hypothetical protein